MAGEIPLSSPDITDLEITMVTNALRSGRLSIGPLQDQFEDAVARRVGARHAVACSSGTAGLHMALLALGIGPGDEVITTPFSFIASANCILYAGATPVFVDIDPRTLNMDPEKVERAISSRTKGILGVEAFGNPSGMDQLRAIAARHEIPLIEDACEGLGGAWRERPIGAFGRVAVFGFYPNKQITTGEGGMIVTDDTRLAEVCRSLRNQGRASGQGGTQAGSWLAHERLGYNYRMSELQAALGLAQMQRLEEIVTRRNEVAEQYMARLLDNTDLILPTVDPETSMSWFVFVVRLRHEFSGEERNRVIDGMRRHDVGAADYFPCIHLQPFYRERYGFSEGEFPIAESVSQRTIALPFHSKLTDRDQDFVVQTLELMISRETLKRT